MSIALLLLHFQFFFSFPLIYVLLGLLWIYFSDTALTFFYDTPESVTYGQHLKGYFFILFTGTLIYFLIKRDFDAVKKAKHDLKQSYEQTIYGWVNVMDIRHQETKSHTERVTKMTLKLAQKVGITDPRELECIQRGAILHDIGKIGIPDGILIKLGDLTAEEWAIIQEHPNIAHEILSKIEYLRPCIDIPYSHHEKWDGSGYSLGLQGTAIPKNQAGIHFDPEILDLFLSNYEEIKAAAGEKSLYDIE